MSPSKVARFIKNIVNPYRGERYRVFASGTEVGSVHAFTKEIAERKAYRKFQYEHGDDISVLAVVCPNNSCTGHS